MNTWLFKVKDNAQNTVSVAGVGADIDAAAVDALGKWDTVMSVRGDYEDRLPRAIAHEMMTTKTVGNEIPTLIV